MQRNSESSESSSDNERNVNVVSSIDPVTNHSSSIKLRGTDTPKRAIPLEVPVVTMRKLNRFATFSKYFKNLWYPTTLY
jgi:hypothetical protein